jgi:hypothetical protein
MKTVRKRELATIATLVSQMFSPANACLLTYKARRGYCAQWQ